MEQPQFEKQSGKDAARTGPKFEGQYIAQLRGWLNLISGESLDFCIVGIPASRKTC